MVKYILTTAMLCLTACSHSVTVSNQNDSLALNDSFISYRQADSIRAKFKVNTMNRLAEDTDGLYLSPIKVISAEPVEDDYSNYKKIRLVFKNVSSKTVAAVKFTWFGLNAFGEAADMGGVIDGEGGGFTDNALRAGQQTSGVWDILSRDLKKVTLAYPIEVVFEDGEKWELRK